MLEDYDAPMLRFEVSRSGAKFKRGLSEQVKGSNKKILKTVMDEAEDTIRSYMEMLHADLPFVRYSAECFASVRFAEGPLGMKNDEILTVEETTALLKTTRQPVRKMIANEELPAVKIGRERRVLKVGIMEFLERKL